MESTQSDTKTDPSQRAVGRKVVHNLNGQRLGRKGMITRVRILNAAQKLIAERHDLQISLSAIASEASLGMTSLYNYFGDLTDVLLALLEDVMVEAEEAYLVHLRTHWEEEHLASECETFINAFFEFWSKHANIFHLRNNFADNRDPKMIAHRATIAREIIGLLLSQMARTPGQEVGPNHMASAVYMGVERAVSVLNNHHLLNDLPEAFRPDIKGLLAAEGKLLEFAIRHERGV